MTDIVERLRNPASVVDEYALRDEAADEIGRLQTANEYAFNELTAARAEIEQLTAALQMIRDDTYDEWAKTIARRALENKP